MREHNSNALRELLRKLEIRRALYLIYGSIFVSYAFLSWFALGYLAIAVIVLDWFLLGIGALLVIFSVFLDEEPKIVRYLPYVGFVISFLVFGELLTNLLPAYATDELASNTYAAYQFMHGLDPYIDSNMAGVFAYSHIPPYSITPLSTGGAVDFLVYPGLSALLFIPAVLFNIRSYEVIVLFAILSIFLLIYYYRKKGMEDTLPFLVVAMIISGQYVYYSLTGDDDIIWVFFIALAYIFRHKPVVSGIFFGLSLSFKQISAIVLPFFMYFLYRESGKKARSEIDFIIGGVASFLITNAPFIWMQPYEWFRHVISVETQPILGAGLGPSVLSFAGYVNISSSAFLAMLVVVLLIFFVLYITYYDQLKYAFFAFPMFIFIFNFRVLENYIAFWPYLILLVIPDFLAEFKTRKSERQHPHYHLMASIRFGIGSQKRVAALFIALIVGAGGFVVYDVSTTHSPVQVSGVWNASDPLWAPGYISEMQVNLSYNPVYGDPSSLDLNYRILPSDISLTLDPNGLLWHSKLPVLPGSSNVSIYPDTYADLLQNNVSFSIEAYYGNIASAFATAKLNTSTASPMDNPNMSLPSYIQNPKYPGWNYTLVSSAGNGTFAYTVFPEGFNLSLDNKHQSKTWSVASVSSVVNISELAAGGYALKYDITNIQSGPAYYSYYTNNSSVIVGASISYYGGIYSLIIGFDPSLTQDMVKQVNSTTLLIISNSTELSFSSISTMLNHTLSGSTINQAVFSYTLMTYGLSGQFYATFYNFDLQNTSKST